MQYFSTGDVARLTGATPWQVARLFEDGVVPEPAGKFGHCRAISRAELPGIIRGLARRGWLKKTIDISAVSTVATA